VSLHSSRAKADVFDYDYAIGCDEAHPSLRLIAAEKLQLFTRHMAGGGSEYVYIGENMKIRFADHANVSSKHDIPDYNCVNRELTDEELTKVRTTTSYPELVKKTALAVHVGCTVPTLKKILTPECYESIVVDPFNYPNTRYEFVRVEAALGRLTAAGLTKRIPVAQETWSEEDYHPGYR
jgi:hypothetical protein